MTSTRSLAVVAVGVAAVLAAGATSLVASATTNPQPVNENSLRNYDGTVQQR